MNLMRSWNVKPNWNTAEAGAGADPQPEDAPSTPDYSWVPETFRQDDQPDTEGFVARYDELEAAEAVRAEAAARVPEAPDGYVLDLPEDMDYGDLELPEEFAFQLDEAEDMAPVIGELQGFLHKHGLPPEAAQEALRILARYEATKFSRGYAAARADFDALGPTASSRVATVTRSLESLLPPDQVKAIKDATGTANGLRAVETLLSKQSMRSAPPQPSGADVSKMSASQKLEHANTVAARDLRPRRRA